MFESSYTKPMEKFIGIVGFEFYCLFLNITMVAPILISVMVAPILISVGVRGSILINKQYVN